MAQQITCPVCRRRLTVADAAPNWLTCPNCLANIDRSAFAQLGEGASAAPQPVIASATAVDREASRDAKIGVVMLWVVGGLAFAGALHLSMNSGTQGWGCMGIAVLLVGLLVLLLTRTAKSAAATSEQHVERGVLPPPLPGHPSGGMLDYAIKPRAGHEAISMGAFAAGFLFALLVCGLGVFLLGATAGGGRGNSGKGIYLMIVIAAVVTVAVLGGSVGGKPGWRGFGPGVACGLGLGMLALGPCGFCYLLALQ